MYTIPAPGESHWYWVLYNIPAATHRLVQNVSGTGTLGNNSVNGKAAYSPPCSQGPGEKSYTFALYALSAAPEITVAPAQVSRDVLLAAIKDRTLAMAELHVTYTRPTTTTTTSVIPAANLVLIPAGEFVMGDHAGYVEPQHPSDEIPLHTVSLSAFYAAKNDVTVQEYCDFLAGSAAGLSVKNGLVYLSGQNDVLFLTRHADQYSRIGWDGTAYTVLDGRGSHPVTSVMWAGAAAYCNWRSTREGYNACYNTSTWQCDFTRNGYRLPTEAEWEYAARGGQTNPYYNYPWGNNADKTRANWPGSGDPWESGPLPCTTPVGFYNGALRQKVDFNWPGTQASYQTADGANGFGIYDMAGNVWQWCNDWYRQDYYKVSPINDPTGPSASEASPMPDGKTYRCMRGGNWYNGEKDMLTQDVDDGHSRVSNRDPSYFRGPQDPNHPYYHIGFRIVRREIK
jgi:formylglycine-generating enzyme required for sulfatase activity